MLALKITMISFLNQLKMWEFILPVIRILMQWITESLSRVTNGEVK